VSDAEATELALLRDLEQLVRLRQNMKDAAGQLPRPRFERYPDVLAQLDAVRGKQA
jgi:hypothetical protein